MNGKGVQPRMARLSAIWRNFKMPADIHKKYEAFIKATR